MQLNCPVAGSSDSMLSTNPGCAWMRGRNWLFIAFLKSFSLAGFMVQVMRRESMFSSFCGKIGNEGFGSPRGLPWEARERYPDGATGSRTGGGPIGVGGGEQRN